MQQRIVKQRWQSQKIFDTCSILFNLFGRRRIFAQSAARFRVPRGRLRKKQKRTCLANKFAPHSHRWKSVKSVPDTRRASPMAMRNPGQIDWWVDEPFVSPKGWL